MKKNWIVTLEITVEAESKEDAFQKAEKRLLSGTDYLLYDAEEEEDD